MQEGVNRFSLTEEPFSLASGWGSGGKTDENLKAVHNDKYIGRKNYINCKPLQNFMRTNLRNKKKKTNIFLPDMWLVM